MFPSWWRNLVRLVNRNGKPLRRGRRKLAKPRSAWHPLVEQFEERLVPTQVSIPTTLAGAPDGVVKVPILVDALNTGNSGLKSGNLVLFYDKKVFTVSSSDVALGTVDPAANGWSLSVDTSVNQQLIIGFSNTTASTSTAGGTLATVNFHIIHTPTLGTTEIDLAADDYQGAGNGATTFINDQSNVAYSLSPAPSNNAYFMGAGSTFHYTGSDANDGILAVSTTAATHFVVSAPGNATAGSVIAFTVTAETASNATATGYTGTAAFTTTDTGASTVLPLASPLVNGVGTFSATLTTAGSQTLTATDTGFYNANVTGTSNSITVTATSASHLVVTAPGVATAGHAITFTVTAEDAYNNTATGYTGTITFTSTDTGASTVLPGSNSTLASGVGTFSATLTTAGSQTIIGADNNTSLITGSIGGVSNSITVVATSASHFVVSAPGAAIAGAPTTFTVTAEDKFNNTATGYTGTVTFTSTDTGASTKVPAPSPLVSGLGTFSATLTTSGSQTITGTDNNTSGATGTISGTSNSIIVSATTASHFVVSAQSATVAGNNMLFTVVAEDKFNNTATGYTGTVTFTSTDTGASTVLPGSNSTLASGVGSFSATLTTAGSQTITGTDNNTSGATGNIAGTSNTITVTATTATHFVVNAQAATVAGSNMLFTVVAEDVYNNTATGYTGTATFTSTDTGASTKLPAPHTLTNSAGTFSATLTTVGTQTITATDAANSLAGTSNMIVVSAATATHFLVTDPTTVAGVPVPFTVVAEDQFNNTATGYGGTVKFTSSDGRAVLPSNSTLAAGQGVFSVTLKTVGSQTVTATDTVTSSITGFSPPITVTPAAANHFVVAAPATAAKGGPFVFTVTARDPFGNLDTNYGGTVVFSSSDGSATLPGNSTLVNGTGTFSATLVTGGNQSLLATDSGNGNIIGQSNNIFVTTAATHFVLSAQSSAATGNVPFTVVAEDQFNNTAVAYTGTATFTSSDTAATFPQSHSSLTNGVGIFTVVLHTLGNQTVTATDNNTSGSTGTITGTSNTINVNSTTATHFVVTAQSPTTAGNNIVFTVVAEDQFNNTATGYTGTVTFTSSDTGASTKLPAPSLLFSGAGTFSATLTTVGGQTLTGTDAPNTLTGTSGTITVSAATATHFVLTAPGAATAGIGITFTATAEDAFNNTAVSYRGIATFTTTSTNKTLPANYTYVAGDNGVHVFSATLNTVGSQTITATDTVVGAIKGNTSTITVTNAAASKFIVTAQSSTAAGANMVFTVQAQDAFSNTAINYAGTIAFTTTDKGAFTVLPLTVFNTLTAGLGTFSATLTSAGSQTITATDTVTSSIKGNSATITVTPLTATQFVTVYTPTGGLAGGFTSPGTATAGSNYLFTLAAEDVYNNLATSYSGAVNWSSNDTGASTVLPSTHALNAGKGTFSATLTTSGSRTITATDTVQPLITGASANINVIGAATAVNIFISAPSTATAGIAMPATVTVIDTYGNVATGYAGTVTITSPTDGAATSSPASGPLSNGVAVFNVTFHAVGASETVKATGTALPAGSTSATTPSINVVPVANHFTFTSPTTATAGNSFTVTVTALDQFNNQATTYRGTVKFTTTDTDPQAKLPGVTGLYTFLASDNGVHVFTNGVTLITATSTARVTVSDVSNLVTAASTGAITVSPQNANQFAISLPLAVTAGTAFNVTVTAQDQYHNTATGYAGTVGLTAATDPAATYTPPNAQSTLTSGVGVFTATMHLATQPGTQVLTASGTGGVSGLSDTFVVSAATATHFTVSAPGTATAGSSVTFTVTAQDQFNNTAPSYKGTVAFSSTDTGASTKLPAASTLASGVGTFSATLTTAGSRTLTATDAPNSVSGTSGPIAVSAATATHFVVSAPTTTGAGSNLTFTVAAEDQFNNTATGYAGNATFTSTDTGASTKLPSPSPLSGGAGIFSATLTTVGSQTLTATDAANSLTGTSGTITVSAAAASHFVVSAPTPTAAGSNVTFTVVAEDQFNNTATGYSGTATFTSTDTGASTVLPAPSTLTNSVGIFSATLTTAGTQTITATDAPNSVTGTSHTITVTALAATHFAVSAPGTATAGTFITFKVTAEDVYNNTAAGYTGTATFTSTDTGASTKLPAPSPLISSVGTFSATLTTAGGQTLTAADAANSLTGTSGTITVSAATATHFILTAPGAATAGNPTAFTITAEDKYNNTAAGYTGTVTFTSSDTGASTKLPAPSPLTSGVGTFSATLTTVGSQTLTGTDAPHSLAATSGTISVSATTASHFAVSAASPENTGIGFSVTVQALDPYNNAATSYSGTVTFSASGAGNTLPGPSTLAAGVGSFSATLGTLSTQTLSASDATTPSITGSAAITMNRPPATHFLLVGSTGTAGAGVQFTFTVTAEDQFNNTAVNFTGTVQFGSSDPEAILPSPSTLSAGVGAFSATLFTAGNQTVTVTEPDPFSNSLAITITPGTAASYFINAPTYATANSAFPFTVTAQDLYGNTATGYFGTVTFSSTDSGPGASVPANSTLSSGVGVFSATLVTPGGQTLTAQDLQNSGINGSAVVTVPVTVFIPSLSTARSTSPANTTVVTVPIEVNALEDPAGGLGQQGLSGGTFVLFYDPSRFSVSASVGTNIDVQLGTLGTDQAPGDGYSAATPNGWQATVLASSPGYLAVTVNPSGGAPELLGTGGGTLVTVNFHVLQNAPLGSSVIDLAADTAGSGSQPATFISDAVDFFGGGSPYNLIPAPLDNTQLSPSYSYAGPDPVDGIINITGTNLPPVANPDNYKITERAVASDPALTVAGPGVLANDTDPQNFPLTAVPASGFTLHGSFTVNSNGSFTYTPNTGYLGADSFTYQASDGYALATGTVNLTVTARLSIPTNLNGQRGKTVVVPVNLDNPNPAGSGGVIAASLALQYDPTVLTFSSVQSGSDYPSPSPWDLESTVNQASGLMGITLANQAGSPNAGTVGDTLVLITFNVNANAAIGQSQIYLVPSNTPGNSTVLTNLTPFNAGYSFPTRPAVQPYPTFVAGVDGIVTITGTVTHFAVTAPSPVTAGNPFVLGVTAEDQFNDTVAGYTGTVAFSSSDSQVAPGAALPANMTLTSGVGSFAALLETAGTQTITATDTANSLTGITSPITVIATVANHFVLTVAPLPSYAGVPGAYPSPAPASSFATTGSAVVFTVVAEDRFNNFAPTYAGTAHFSSSDTAFVGPAASSLSAGVGTFSATLGTAGNQFITATDNNNPTINGATSAIVTRGLVVTSFTPTPTGFIITFNQPFNPSTVLIYSNGTPSAALSDDIILKSTATQPILGSALFNSPTAPTSITFVKTDVASAVGAFNPATGLLSQGNYTVTLRSFNAGNSNGFKDNLGDVLDGTDQGLGLNYVYTFSVAAPPTAVGIADFARGPSNTDAVFLPTTIGNGNTFNLIYTNPAYSGPTTGTATVTFSTIGATLQANIQAALNALPQIGLGAGSVPNAVVVANSPLISNGFANVQVTFQNSGFVTATSQLLSSTSPNPVTFALATINAANNIAGDGIPVALSNPQNVLSGSFTLQYNPALLTITGGTRGAALTASGGTFTVTPTINNATSATALISFSSPTKISSTTAALTLGSLLATVPFSATASYGAKQLLHFSSEQLNTTASSNIAVTNQDAVEVAAFFGNVSGNDVSFPSSGDQPLIGAVGNESFNATFDTLPGFSAFPNLDPIIIGGVSQAGQPAITNSGDAGTLLKELTTPQPAIPWLPVGLPMNTMGPDPTLSVPTDLVAAPGGIVIVPVNIDTARPEGIGMVEAVLALTYDPKVFDVSAADVQLGTVPEAGSGWQLKTEVNAQTGLIGVELYSNTPIQSSAGGSLVAIAMHVRETAPAGTTGLTLVPYVDPAGGVGVYETSLLGTEGEFILHPAQTAAGTEPGAPGLVTIASHTPVEGGLFLVPQAEAAVSAPAGPTTFDLQLPAVGTTTAASSALPLAVVEQVFGTLEQTAVALQDSALIQPAAILSSESSDQAHGNVVRDLALLQAPAGVAPAEWLPEDLLAYLGQTAGRGLLASGANLLDGEGPGAEGVDLDGVEAFFAREAAKGGLTHTRSNW